MCSTTITRWCKLIAISAVVSLLLAALCHAADFTASMKTTFGKVAIPGKLYVCGDNWRQEATIDGKQQIIIAHGSTLYILDPAAKHYRQIHSHDKPWSASSMIRIFSPGMSKKCLGKTTMNGVTCEKYVYTARIRAQRSPSSITQYVVKELDLSVRTEIKMPQGSTLVEFTNIKKGRSPASLFQIPKGYRATVTPEPTKRK